ncbi:hypothetical protein [Vibrio phage CKB-S2]|nr:hypothetical protein [Vibrio phage CKB-S2]
MKKEAENNQITFVYMGERLVQGAMYACVCPVVEGIALTSNYSLFKTKRRSMLITGWVHSAEGEKDENQQVTKIIFDTVQAIREQVLPSGFAEQMRLEQQEDRTKKAMIDKAKKDTATQDIRGMLAPIRRAMNKTNHQGRAALLALVIQELTR